MTVPVFCRHCGEIVGEYDGFSIHMGESNYIACSTCDHKVTKTKRILCFGWIEEKKCFYHDTGTESCARYYVGKPVRWRILLAMVLTRSYHLYVPGYGWIFRNVLSLSLYGEGARVLHAHDAI